MSLEQFFKEASFEEGLLLVSFYDHEKHASGGWAGAWDQMKNTWGDLGSEMQKGLKTVGIGTALGAGAGLVSAGASDKKRRNWLGKGLTGAALGAMGGAVGHLGMTAYKGVVNPSEDTQPATVETRIGERVGEKLKSTGKPIGWSGSPDVPTLWTAGPRLASDPKGEGTMMGAGAGAGLLTSMLLKDKMPGATLRGQRGAEHLLSVKDAPKGMDALHKKVQTLGARLGSRGISDSRQAELIGQYGSAAPAAARAAAGGINLPQQFAKNMADAERYAAARMRDYQQAVANRQAFLLPPSQSPAAAAAERALEASRVSLHNAENRLSQYRHRATQHAAAASRVVQPANRTLWQKITQQRGPSVTQSALQQVGRPKGFGHAMKRHWLGAVTGLAAELLLSNNLRQAPANMYQEHYGRPYGD